MKTERDLNSFRLWSYKRSVRAGDTARSSKNWSRAYKEYRASLAILPDAAHIWVQLGHAAKELADFHAAQKAYQTAATLNPSDVDIKIQLGHLFKEMGHHASALVQYEAALSLGSTDPHAVDYIFRRTVSRADEARENGRLEAAANLYREALAQRSDFEIFMQLGACLRNIGELADAQLAYRSALELRPGDRGCIAEIEEVRELGVASTPSSHTNSHPTTVHSPGMFDGLGGAHSYRNLSESVIVIFERIQNAFLHRIA